MPSSTDSQIFDHPVSGNTLRPILKDLLPYSLPIYRRIQFPHRTDSSHIFATFPPNSPKDDSNDANPIQTPLCFAIAFVDRSRRPETEAWIFLSSEVPGRCSDDCASCKAALLALTKHISTLPLPESIHAANMTGDSKYLTHVSNPDIILVGALHTLPSKILGDAKLIALELPGYTGYEYAKYIFQSSTLPAPSTLPSGLHWGKVRKEDLSLVRARTDIPRQEATLSLLPSIAIFPEPVDGKETAPIAWSFLGLDGSLTSLHVEPEWRGKGLAKQLAAKLFRESSVGDFGAKDDGDVWAHADVALANSQSRGVCKSLGGVVKWHVYWLRIDLGRFKS
jgi:GNAT superfamily N-acetyltransferase